MYLNTEPSAPAKVMKLSEAVRDGAKRYPECGPFDMPGDAHCAVGGAGWLLGWKDSIDFKNLCDFMHFVSEKTGVPVAVIQEASRKHHERYLRGFGLGGVDGRPAIADWLESQGY